MDEPLNDVGRQQASILGQYLKSQLLTHAFSSDLSRTKETTELILKHFVSPPNTILDERLRERRYGVMEGQLSTTLKNLAIKTNTNILEFTPDGAENLQELASRVVSFFQDLCVSLMRQFSSSPPTPRQLSTSRRASRASILNTWLEEAGNCTADPPVDNNSPLLPAKFYVDDPVTGNDCCSSQDSGISGVFSADTLTIDTALKCNQNQMSFPADSLSPNGRSSTNASPATLEWPPHSYGGSPGFSSQSAAAAKINGNGERHNRKVSMQSIASDDSNYPEIDAHVLIVSHGGPIREMIRYLVEDLSVSTPGGKGAALRPCPNTGFSTFFVSVEDDANEISVTCLNLYSKDHLLEYNLTGPTNVEAI